MSESLLLVRGSYSLEFVPMVLDHGVSTDVLMHSIELMVLGYYGFGPWYCEGPKAI